VKAMITPTMKKFLNKAESDPQIKKSIKYCVYVNRIQKRIEKEMDSLLWLAVNHPDILLDEEKEYKDETGKIICHRRLKKLLLTVKAVNPKMEVELVLKNLEFPEKEKPIADYRELLKMKTCPKCGLTKDICTCEETKEEEPSARTSVMPRPSN
jgi:hypothetical protein